MLHRFRALGFSLALFTVGLVGTPNQAWAQIDSPEVAAPATPVSPLLETLMQRLFHVSLKEPNLLQLEPQQLQQLLAIVTDVSRECLDLPQEEQQMRFLQAKDQIWGVLNREQQERLEQLRDRGQQLGLDSGQARSLLLSLMTDPQLRAVWLSSFQSMRQRIQSDTGSELPLAPEDIYDFVIKVLQAVPSSTTRPTRP